MHSDLAAEPFSWQKSFEDEVIKVQSINAWTGFGDDLAITMYICYRATHR